MLALILCSCTIPIKLKGKRYHPKTADGWKITVEEFAPRSETRRKHPVLFLHGLMSNRHGFTVSERKSLVYMLTQEGYRVFTADMRGRPDAGSPSWFFGKYRYDYNADDYARYDVPAAISFVLKRTGKEGVNVIGHSMGGLLTYITVGSYGEKRVANMVTIASPGILTPAHKVSTLGYKARGVMKITPVIPARMFASMAGHMRLPPYPPDLATIVWYGPNMARPMQHKMMQHGVNNAAPRVMFQFVGAVRQGRFRSANHKLDYTGNLSRVTVPALLLAGRRDHLVSTANVRYTYEQLGSTDKTMLVIGRTSGAETDYGHVDLIAGKNIHRDVNPPIIAWLNARN